ncbi:PEPxxWA-CTERM sorting domain-containing protein [Phenylobacterium sp.]|jgi:hypothetical protein|uniref:PEPxxWA-CTERM sorting domain-containing protein n=1 Tax=Phenylobacterium sp. TaxID=1871053 RepID=UPI002F41254F
MRKILLAGAAAAGLALAAASAHATDFVLQDYSVVANIGNADSNHGLTVDTLNLLTIPGGGLNIDLGSPTSETLDLFKIYTPETSVNSDDQVPVDIDVNFDFSAPAPNSGTAQVGGTTQGNLILHGFFQNGSVSWSGPAQFTWTAPGLPDPGLMTISLSNGSFDTGLLGPRGGERDGYVVQATFDWDHDPVPEPTTWALMLSGFGLAGAALRRRRAVATVA